MRNKKLWLFIKGFMILLLTVVIFLAPTPDIIRKWIRFLMLVIFSISFLVDLSHYKKNNA